MWKGVVSFGMVSIPVRLYVATESHSASFHQLSEQAAGDADAVAAEIMRIVSERGKMHNPVTGSGGMLVGNVADNGFENNPYLDRLREFAAKQNAPVVAICAKTEAELADMAPEDVAQGSLPLMRRTVFCQAPSSRL